MESFSRAYRDPKSPLAPLTPLSINNAFSFRLGGDDSLKTWIEQIDATRQKRSSNSCGMQTRLSPNNAAGLQSKSLPNNSTKFSNISSSTKYSKSLNLNVASTLVANCLMPRCGANKSVATPSTKSGTTTKLGVVSGDVSSYKTACASSSSSASRYGTAKSSTDTTRSHFVSACNSASTCYATAHAARSRYSSGSSSTSCYLTAANSSDNITTAGCGCGCRRATPKIVIENKNCAVDKPATSSSMFNWICEQLSPSPRKKGAVTMGDCLYALLSNFGMEKYWTLFEREEIDMDVFRTLTYNDLNTLGITNAADCKGLINAVTAAHNINKN